LSVSTATLPIISRNRIGGCGALARAVWLVIGISNCYPLDITLGVCVSLM
jgi:hypothetical protein